MTFEEFNAAVRGKRKLIESDQREEWERVRWQSAVLLQPHISKGKRLTPQKLLRFPWEKNTKEAPTRKELKASLERIKKRDKDKWQS